MATAWTLELKPPVRAVGPTYSPSAVTSTAPTLWVVVPVIVPTLVTLDSPLLPVAATEITVLAPELATTFMVPSARTSPVSDWFEVTAAVEPTTEPVKSLPPAAVTSALESETSTTFRV